MGPFGGARSIGAGARGAQRGPDGWKLCPPPSPAAGHLPLPGRPGGTRSAPPRALKWRHSPKRGVPGSADPRLPCPSPGVDCDQPVGTNPARRPALSVCRASWEIPSCEAHGTSCTAAPRACCPQQTLAHPTGPSGLRPAPHGARSRPARRRRGCEVCVRTRCRRSGSVPTAPPPPPPLTEALTSPRTHSRASAPLLPPGR